MGVKLLLICDTIKENNNKGSNMKNGNEEVRVVSRNAFSKLRLWQLILAIIFIIGVIGFSSKQETIFAFMVVIGLVGIILIRFLRWMHRD
jgi:hypothetical protein